MAITLAEEIMLLSLDDESGSAKQRQATGWAVSGGILLGSVPSCDHVAGWRLRDQMTAPRS
jgi:hypothetical protein